MDPKQYNEKIYNKGVVLLREKIREFEENLVNGKIQIKNIRDFEIAYQEVENYLSDLEQVVEQPYSAQLEVYFGYEKKFLMQLQQFMAIFNDYHKVMGEFFLTDELITQEWEDIVTLMHFDKVEHEFKEFMKMGTLATYDAKSRFSNFLRRLNDTMVHADYEEATKENWQDVVKAKLYRELEQEILLKEQEEIQANILSDVDFFQLAQMLKELEKDLNENVYPRMQRRMKVTKEKNKEKSVMGSFHAFCDEIIKETQKIAVESCDHVLTASENPVYYQKMRSKEYQDERRKDIFVEPDFLLQLTTSSKIKYIRLVLQNIIKKGYEEKREALAKVKIDGKSYKYPKRYQYRVGNYLAQLKQLEAEQEKEQEIAIEEEKSNSLKTESEISEIIAERYAELYLKLEDVISSMQFLEQEAATYLNKDKIVSSIVDGREIFVLETNLEKYMTLYEKKKSIEVAINEIEVKNNYHLKENDSYENVRFVKDNEKDPARKQKLLEFWKKKQREAHKGEQNALYANSLLLAKKLNIPEKFQKLYTSILHNPKKFVKSKKYSDSTKRKGIGNLHSLLNGLSDKNVRNEKFATFVENTKEKILDALAVTPVKDSQTYFVKRVRKPKENKNTKQSDWKQIIAVAGAVYVMGMGALFALFKPVLDRSPLVPRTKDVPTTLDVQLDDQVMLTAVEKFADQVIQFQKENVDWEISFTKNRDAYEVESKTSSRSSTVFSDQVTALEEPPISEEKSDDEINLHEFVSIKPNSMVYSVHGDSLKGVDPQECTADTSVLYEITGIQYENGAWISAESTEYDPDAMNRAYNAQGEKVAEVRLVNASTGEYLGHFTLDSIEREKEFRNGR